MLKETRSLQSDLNKRGFRDKDRDISRVCKDVRRGSEEEKEISCEAVKISESM